MLYFANPVGPEVQAKMRAGQLGCIVTPVQGNEIPAGAVWCADNGCFGKGYPGDDAWIAWLERRLTTPGCVFAVAPDVVGDAEATLARSAPWLPRIRALGVPAAFVAQNGLEHLDVPWDAFDVLFVGGCPECPDDGPTLSPITRGTGAALKMFCPVCRRRIGEWKEGPAAAQLVGEARARGKQAHMGRVNGGKRYRLAAAMGCTSVDGTTLTRGVDKNLPGVLSWMERHRVQEALL